MLRVVVLGTGTGVGKTWVCERLVRALRSTAPTLSIGGVKPIETGLSAEAAGLPAATSDAARLERVSTAGLAPRPHPLFGFTEAVSPHLAARTARRSISAQRIAQWVHTLRYDICVVESAGGAFSPISSSQTNADIAAALEPAVWVLVAPDALGVLHDVRATWSACRARGRVPDYLVLSTARLADASTGTNAREMARVGLPAPVAVCPRRGNPAALRRLARLLCAHPLVTSPVKDDRPQAPVAHRSRARKSPGRGSRSR